MARPIGARDDRPLVTVLTVALCAALPLLGGCLGTDIGRHRTTPRAEQSPPADVPQAVNPGTAVTPAAGGQQRIGSGTVKVALILPLSGQGAAVGAAMRNAAQLAFDEAQQPDLRILVETTGAIRTAPVTRRRRPCDRAPKSSSAPSSPATCRLPPR